MASCPTAMKIEVDGYIAMTLAPTYYDVKNVLATRSTWTDLGTESKVTEDSDYLVNTNSGTNRCAYNNIHAALCIAS